MRENHSVPREYDASLEFLTLRSYVPCMKFRTFISALVISSLNVQSINAGEEISLGEKVFTADAIVEIELSFRKPIPRNWKNKTYNPTGWAFPGQLANDALSNAVVSRVIFATVSPDKITLPSRPFVFAITSPCWWQAHENKSVRSLVFLKRDENGTWKQFFGVEHETGRYSNLNPSYELLVTAIQEARAWPEERMHAVHADALWQTQRSILRESSNPYQQVLAVAFLEGHGGSKAITDVWKEHNTDLRLRALREQTTAQVCK